MILVDMINFSITIISSFFIYLYLKYMVEIKYLIFDILSETNLKSLKTSLSFLIGSCCHYLAPISICMKVSSQLLHLCFIYTYNNYLT